MSAANDNNLQRKIKLSYAIADKKAQQGLWGYLENVIINSSPLPMKFGMCMTDMQRNDIFKPLVPAMEAVAGFNKNAKGVNEYNGVKKFMYVLAKGFDKSSSQARLINWLIAYGKRPVPLKIYSGAANLDQSNIILDAMKTEAMLNPWLTNKLRFIKNECLGRGGSLKCLTSDADSIAGILPDVIIIDEPTRHDSDFLYRELMGGAGKRKGCLVIVITNAGVKGSWMWDEYQNAKNSDAWYLFESPAGVRPNWVDEDVIADLRRSMTPDAARRLFDNIWTEEDEDSYVLRSEVLGCEQLASELNLCLRTNGEKQFVYYCGVDYGSVKDRTALCVLHYDKKQDRVIVDKLDVWQGSPQDKIKLKDVEEWMEEQHYAFHNPIFICDKYQMEGSIQKLEGKLRIRPFEYRGGKKNYEMAELLRTLIINKRIAWYQGAGDITVGGKRHSFGDELTELIVRRMSYGYRFDHDSGKHDDRAVCVGMAALSSIKDTYEGMGELPPTDPNEGNNPFNPLSKLNNLNVIKKDHNIFGMK
jgi:hypothetical protein